MEQQSKTPAFLTTFAENYLKYTNQSGVLIRKTHVSLVLCLRSWPEKAVKFTEDSKPLALAVCDFRAGSSLS